jgi:hypothetical protein
LGTCHKRFLERRGEHLFGVDGRHQSPPRQTMGSYDAKCERARTLGVAEVVTQNPAF